MFFSEAEIEGRVALRQPENLIFADAEILWKIAQDDFNEEAVRANCLAELLIREYFSQDVDLRERLETLLSHGEVAKFLWEMPINYFSANASITLWETDDSLSVSCRAALRKRLQRLFLTIGVIPVEQNNLAGWMIPFHFVESEGQSAVFDLDGTIIPAWSEAISMLKLPVSVCLHCYCCPEMGTLTGHSLMLPVFAAYHQRQGDLPRNNPFRVILTGALDEHGFLMPVETAGKVRALQENFPNAHFLLPESSAGNENSRQVTFLPLLNQTELLPHLQCAMERLNNTQFEYAFRRLPFLADDVRKKQYCNWDDLILRLTHNAQFDEDENPEEYLLSLILQSEANCHAGHTDKAEKLNRKARRFAAAHGTKFENILARLQVNRLVLLLDGERFEEIGSIVPDLKETIEKIGDVDLEMRFHGTMGQIEAYGTLAGVENCSKEAALQHFLTAKDKAFKLGTLEDKRQDINYIHLWYALFMPGSEEEQEALTRAEKMSEPHADESENSPNRIRNLCYLRRQQLFAWYRKWLLTGQIPKRQLPDDIKYLLDGEHTWCRALAYKYLGTLAAAGKEMAEAQRCFQKAVEPIQGEKDSIIQYIKMTIYAEAYRSLNEENYCEQGKVVAENLRTIYSRPQAIAPWIAYFKNQKNNSLFQYYWY